MECQALDIRMVNNCDYVRFHGGPFDHIEQSIEDYSDEDAIPELCNIDGHKYAITLTEDQLYWYYKYYGKY